MDMENLEDKFIKRLEEIALERGCKPIPLGFLSMLDQPKEATEFWHKLSDFCQHVQTDKGFDIYEAIQYEFKYRHGLL